MAFEKREFNKIPPQVKEVAETMYDAPRGFKGATSTYPVIHVTQEAEPEYDFAERVEYVYSSRLTMTTLLILEMEMEVTEAQQLRKIAELMMINPEIKFEGVTDLDYLFMRIEIEAEEQLQPLRIESEASARKVRELEGLERVYLTLTVTLDMSGREWRYNPESGDLIVLHRTE